MPQGTLACGLGGCSAAEFGVRPDHIVVEPLVAEHHPGMAQGSEQGLVEALIAKPTVETFAEGILLGLAGGDIVPDDEPVLRPAQDGALVASVNVV